MQKSVKNWSMDGCTGRFYTRGKNNVIWYRKGTNRISTKLPYSPQNKIIAGEMMQKIELNYEGKAIKTMTIVEAYKYFLEQEKENKSKKTLRLYNSALKQLISINYTIDNYVAIRKNINDNLAKLKVLNQSKNSRLSNIKSFFQYFIDFEFIEKNPVTKKMFLKVVEKPIEIFTEDEIKSIFEYLARKDIRTQMYFKILYYCAFRREELSSMNWEQVIDDNGSYREHIIIPLSKYRNKMDKFPLTAELIKMFENIGGTKNGKIFCSSEYYYAIFKTALNWAGVKSKIKWEGNTIGLHTLRKTRISEWLFKQQLPVQVVSELSRDNINTIMKFYAKLSSNKLHSYLK